MKEQMLEEKRQKALASFEDLNNPQFWRFQPEFSNGEVSGGVWLGRKLFHLSNAELFGLFERNEGLRLATLQELRNSQTLFKPTGYIGKPAPQPWGFDAFWHANRLFVEEGIGINGILWGASPVGCWAVVSDGNFTVRQGAAWNVGLFDDFLDEQGHMIMPSKEMAQGILDMSRVAGIKSLFGLKNEDNTEIARYAGYGLGLELEDNEAYLLAKPANAQEIWLMKKLISVQGAKLFSDSGNPCLSMPEIIEQKVVVYFAAGGGCSRCSRLENTTRKTFAEDALALISAEELNANGFDANEVCIKLLPEYENWKERKMFDTIMSLAVANIE